MSNQIEEMNWPEVIKASQEKFIKSAPKTIDFEKESFFAIQHIQNNDFLRSVARENPMSVQSAMISVASVGLSLNPAKKQAYLIPRNIKTSVNGQDKWISKVCFEPSYMGLCDLATMSGSIKWVQAKVVYENDTFEDNGPGEKPTHTYKAFAKREERGEFAGVYCVAKTADGDYLTTVMPAEDVYSIRDRSEAWKNKLKKEREGKTGFGGPWETDFNEQAKKTVVRNAFKMWPKTDTMERMEMAVQMSNDNEGFEPILTNPDMGQYTAEQKTYYDQCITQSDHIGMFMFKESIEEAVWINLYHSFEKGAKGKFQGVVNALCEKGRSQMTDTIEAVNERAEAGDEGGVIENVCDISADAVKWISDRCSDEARKIIAEMK